MDYKAIGNNIEALRLSHKLKQEEFAKKLDVSRPTVSNWEQGKSLPTTSQLIKLSEVFSVSADELLGLKGLQKVMCIVDSSILCRRPRILDEMKLKNIHYICITETILSEMNRQKDHGKRPQQAWIAMKSFNNCKEEDKNRFRILPDVQKEEANDDRIISTALHEAEQDNFLMVYLLSEDIYFPLKGHLKAIPNFKVLSLCDYEKKFSCPDMVFDIDASNSFYAAVCEKDIEKAKKIKQNNSNININHTNAKTGFTPCIQAIRNKDKNMLEYLLSLPGIDVNKCDDAKYRFPPITHAVQLKNKEYIKILLQNGADIDIGSLGKNKGNTALMVAAWHGHLDIVEYLVEQGACCNQQDLNGFTPLIKACIRKHPDVVKYLFDKTDRTIHSREYKTAKDYALKMDNTEISYMFLTKR